MNGGVSLQDAYAEACRQLGEAQVMNALMSKELERLSAEMVQLQQSRDEPPAPAPR